MIRVLLVAVMAILFFSGCVGEKVASIEPVYEKETVYVTPPAKLLDKGELPKPFSREAFLNADNITQKRMLGHLIDDLYVYASELRSNLDKINIWTNEVTDDKPPSNNTLESK